MSFSTEFPDCDAASLPVIPSNWVDTSWRNDACPSFDTQTGYRVFIDYANQSDREFNQSLRFSVHTNTDHVAVAFESDDWSAVLVFLISDNFAAALRQYLTSDEYAEMQRRNASDNNPLVCHSHDFCDANEIMDAAFIAVLGRSSLPDDIDAGMSDADIAMWNAAWNTARKLNLI